eukprot:IDg9388t1
MSKQLSRSESELDPERFYDILVEPSQSTRTELEKCVSEALWFYTALDTAKISGFNFEDQILDDRRYWEERNLIIINRGYLVALRNHLLEKDVDVDKRTGMAIYHTLARAFLKMRDKEQVFSQANLIAAPSHSVKSFSRPSYVSKHFPNDLCYNSSQKTAYQKPF